MQERTRTKIVATIGPASASASRVDALLEAGMDVARINCAHASPAQIQQLVALLRERAQRRQRPLAILGDLAGPKLRIGRFRGGAIRLARGQRFTLTTRPVEGTEEAVSIEYRELPREAKPGDTIFLNDGLIRLRVTRATETDIETEVQTDGEIGDGKGLALPGAGRHVAPLTEKDWRDLDALVAAGVDYVGLSFVRDAQDVEALRRGLAARGAELPIVAKIEKREAIENLDRIAAAADAVMVARGDLGVECPIEQVPLLQKHIIRTCNGAGVPVTTATQMLESMVRSPMPTRAEATDVANAVLDGTDAVMLSAETATGQYPVEAVQVMRRIVAEAERCPGYPVRPASEGEWSIQDAIARSACLAAESAAAEAIVCLTHSGATARALAKWRPRQRILAITPTPSVWRRCSALWGVEPFLVEDIERDFDRAVARILAFLRQRGEVSPGAKVVVTAGLPFGQRRGTNTARIESA